MNHLRFQWRDTALRREAIAARNGLTVEVDYVGGGKENIFGHTNWQGVIRAGHGFRAFGSWGEFKDSIKGGRWRSKAGFTIEGEGETQFTTSLEVLLKWESPASYVGTVGIIEADLSGCKMRTFIHTVVYGPGGAGGHASGMDGTYLWLPHEGAREGVIYVPDTGLGVGVDGGVPLNQIIRVFEIEKRQIVRSWPFREWPDHIERVKDPKPPPPPSPPVEVCWYQAGDVVFPEGNPVFHSPMGGGSRFKTRCGLTSDDTLVMDEIARTKYRKNITSPHSRSTDAEIKKAKSTGTLECSYAFGSFEPPSVRAKPCPKCWKSL